MIKEAIKRSMKYPDGVYISIEIDPETIKNIYNYMDKHLPDLKKHEDMHVTIIYSTKPMNKEIKTEEYTAEATFKNFNLFGKDDKYIVAELKCSDLDDRNEKLTDQYGFVSDFDEYKPHFTFSFDHTDIDVTKLPKLDFPILLENETVKPLDSDYGEDND